MARACLFFSFLVFAACGNRVPIGAEGGPACTGACSCVNSAPVPLATQRYSPQGIAVDSNNVYWTESEGGPGAGALLLQAPLGGGALTVLATDIAPIGRLAIDANSLYWMDQGYCVDLCATDHSIKKLALDGSGGAPVTLADQLESYPNVESFAVNANGLYWLTTNPAGAGTDPGLLMSLGLDGGTPVSLGAAHPEGGLAVDSNDVYWFSDDGIMKLAPSDSAPIAIAPGQSGNALAVDDAHIYWAGWASTDPDNQNAGTILQAQLDGGAVTTLAVAQPIPIAIAVNASGVYWLNQGADPSTEYLTAFGSVARVGFNGCAPETLATTQAGPANLVLDASGVYWTNSGTPSGANEDGSVMKLFLEGTQ